MHRWRTWLKIWWLHRKSSAASSWHNKRIISSGRRKKHVVCLEIVKAKIWTFFDSLKVFFPGFQLFLWSCLGRVFYESFFGGRKFWWVYRCTCTCSNLGKLGFFILHIIFIFPWCCLVRRNGGSWSVELLCCIADRPRRKNGNGSCTKSARNVKNLQLFVPRSESHGRF